MALSKEQAYKSTQTAIEEIAEDVRGFDMELGDDGVWRLYEVYETAVSVVRIEVEFKEMVEVHA